MNPERTMKFYILSDFSKCEHICAENHDGEYHIFVHSSHEVNPYASHPHISHLPSVRFSENDAAIAIATAVPLMQATALLTDPVCVSLQSRVHAIVQNNKSYALSGHYEEGTHNLLRNVTHPTSTLASNIKDVPAIVIGNGYSLCLHIHALRALQQANTHVLIACGSTLQTLHTNEIEPHFCVVTDPQEQMYEKLKPAIHTFTNCHLLASVNAHHRIVAEWRGPVSLFYSPHTPEFENSLISLAGIMPRYDALASVATTAAHFALETLHARQLILVGVDMCKPCSEYPSDVIAQCENGREVATNHTLLQCRWYLEKLCTLYVGKVYHVNPAEIGGQKWNGLHITNAQTTEDLSTFTKCDLQELPRFATRTNMPTPKLLAKQLKDIRTNYAAIAKACATQNITKEVNRVGFGLVKWYVDYLFYDSVLKNDQAHFFSTLQKFMWKQNTVLSEVLTQLKTLGVED